jgi:hypothetical protein
VSDSSGSDKKTVVLKIGGSVLTGTKAYRRVSLYLKHRLEHAPNEKLVVVVSAQKLATNTLERRARRIVRSPGVRALDLLWSTGELRSVALMALYLQEAGMPSLGLNVHETGLQYSNENQSCPARPGLTGGRPSGYTRRASRRRGPGFSRHVPGWCDRFSRSRRIGSVGCSRRHRSQGRSLRIDERRSRLF